MSGCIVVCDRPIELQSVLDDQTIGFINNIAVNRSNFVEGKLSATGLAALRKNNIELADLDENSLLARMVSSCIFENSVISDQLFPSRICNVLISRYERNMEYGYHVDSPFMRGARADFSFTLFASQPEDYEGGELEICWGDKRLKYKPGRGSLVVYPNRCLHRVTKVLSGVRVCVVGWFESHIPNHHSRQQLIDLREAAQAALDENGDEDMHLKLLQIYANLCKCLAFNS